MLRLSKSINNARIQKITIVCPLKIPGTLLHYFRYYWPIDSSNFSQAAVEKIDISAILVISKNVDNQRHQYYLAQTRDINSFVLYSSMYDSSYYI